MLKSILGAFWEKRERRYALFSFLLSLFGILLTFLAAGIPPFGERSLLSMDAWSQYFPMLMEGKDGLSQWSFSGALGFNRLAQSAYYTMSPLNLLVYLFPRGGMYIALHLVIALRFALAGLFFYLFLAYRHRPTAAGAVFSLAYSLSAYPLAFLNQFMWLDAVALLPLVALGLLRLIRERKPLLYVFSLALTLYSCFYIGYMVCLFSVLYFVGRVLCERLTLRETAGRCGTFAVFSLLAGGLAAAVLLPTYLALQGTIASSLGFEGELRLYHGFLDVVRQLLPFGKFSLELQAPNLYCGTLTVLLFVAALFNSGKRLRERILLVLAALLIYFSCTLNLLDFVWHGMHYPNQLPGRQSFLFIFLIVGVAYDTYLSLSEAGWLKRWRLRLAPACLLLLLSAEVLLNAAIGVAGNTWTCNLSSYAYWDRPMAYVEKTYSDGPWRSEKLTPFHFNSGQLYRYYGISFYSSTMGEEAYRFFGRLGMGVYAQNVSTLYKPTNILNMLFGVRYLHAYNGDLPEEGLLVDRVETVETVTVYENRYCLPLAFLASPDALALDTEAYSGWMLENRMLGSLLGDGEGRCYYTENAIRDAYSRLSDGAMALDEFSSVRISGRVAVGEDTLLFTSIPADKGWRVTVDGERVEPVTVFGYLLGVPLSPGEHTVELSYTAPGF
ncbi:MAG: YfhO family protein, partial [Clostridia bacterium]|nr:YfhO family protein [Clostridia bacterium]